MRTVRKRCRRQSSLDWCRYSTSAHKSFGSAYRNHRSESVGCTYIAFGSPGKYQNRHFLVESNPSALVRPRRQYVIGSISASRSRRTSTRPRESSAILPIQRTQQSWATAVLGPPPSASSSPFSAPPLLLLLFPSFFPPAPATASCLFFTASCVLSAAAGWSSSPGVKRWLSSQASRSTSPIFCANSQTPAALPPAAPPPAAVPVVCSVGGALLSGRRIMGLQRASTSKPHSVHRNGQSHRRFVIRFTCSCLFASVKMCRAAARAVVGLKEKQTRRHKSSVKISNPRSWTMLFLTTAASGGGAGAGVAVVVAGGGVVAAAAPSFFTPPPSTFPVWEASMP
mmetsp:Transcript_23244/g.31798  ORF Transcript_23244/g.31798 Transcript_23244/m.31798 type:complete len:340 (+) Transcript_23244:81-1100(+)